MDGAFFRSGCCAAPVGTKCRVARSSARSAAVLLLASNPLLQSRISGLRIAVSIHTINSTAGDELMSYTADFAETTRGRVDLPNGAYAGPVPVSWGRCGREISKNLARGLVAPWRLARLWGCAHYGRSPLSAGSDILGAARVSLCPFRCIPMLSRTEAPAWPPVCHIHFGLCVVGRAHKILEVCT